MSKDISKHEMESRVNALNIAIRQSDSRAIAHLEAVVGAILLTMDSSEKDKVMREVAQIENLEPDILANVKLYGEMDGKEKPLRQKWRDELTDLLPQLDKLNENYDSMDIV